MNARTQGRLGLSVVEVGWILQKTEGQVRGMVRRGDLRYAVAGRKIDAESVDELLGSQFDRKLLEWLLLGLIVAPTPLTRYGPPADLMDALRQAALRNPALVQDSRSGRVVVVPRLDHELGNFDSASADSGSAEGSPRSLDAVLSFIKL